ncbi:MAG: ABC transporter ATP-binding protein [Rhodobacteraceae bacterium]|nr:ABC transporter ATP-binding protein [Paracoccaceae bacterium]
MPILELNSVSKRYGALTVTDDVSFSLEEGATLGIIGPNRGGKSTLFNLIGGTDRVNEGAVLFQGRDVTRTGAADRCHAGIARSFQIPHPFVGMTVFENLLVADAFGTTERHAREDRCRNILDQTGLLPKANRPAGSLTLLERKRLELARALATDPKLLLLDEIAGGLTEGECKSLVETIKSIRDRGVSIIWIEHIVHALTAVVERLIVIDYGKVIADGAPADVMALPVVKEIYLGIDLDEQAA